MYEKSLILNSTTQFYQNNGNTSLYVISNTLGNNNLSNDMYSGIDWIYSFVETIYTYDFRIFYFKYYNLFFDESTDYFYNLFWFFTISSLTFQLFWASVLDTYVFTSLLKISSNDSWYKTILMSNDTLYIFIYHPELVFLKQQIFSTYLPYFSKFVISLNETTIVETITSPVILLPQFLIILYFTLIFISFYFTYFSTYTKEESTIDADYLICSATVEAEKEITAFDDMILGFVVLIYIFGWYFYIHCWSLVSSLPEIAFLFYLFPGLYFIIFGIPTSLAYNFGIYFLAYLRGVGASPVLTFELMYDYIAVIIFYTRILVQGVRLVLMLFTFASLNEFMLFFTFPQKSFVCPEHFWEELNNISLTTSSMSYFFLTVFPGQLVYWVYEILHTYFVVTVQFSAFFAIVFWLFLFLYTFFVSEKHEDYFVVLRGKYKNKKDDLIK